MKSIRESFLPDEGCVFVRCDLSQVELRIGQMYCRTQRMVKIANSKPWEYDGHTETARVIFQKEKITKQERYLAKKVNHASWREMQGDKMSESVSKDTKGELFIPAKKCQSLINNYLKNNPEIEEIYFPWCRAQVQNGGVCRNSWGRIFDVSDLRIDSELYRKVYSFYMQSECAEWTNQYLLLPIYYYMLARYNKPPAAQVHDEVVVSVPWKDSYDVACFLVRSAEQTREIPTGSGNYLCVPGEVIVGNSWGDGRFEFKQMPSRKEYEEITYALRKETLLGKS